MARPKIEPMTTVPAGLTVDVTVTMPKHLGNACEGLRWTAPREMSADEARADIGRHLFVGALDSFLLSTPKPKE